MTFYVNDLNDMLE